MYTAGGGMVQTEAGQKTNGAPSVTQSQVNVVAQCEFTEAVLSNYHVDRRLELMSDGPSVG